MVSIGSTSLNLYFILLVFWRHDDVIKWKNFPRYWPFVRGIHRSPVNSPHKGQWRGALMFSLMYVWINGWVNNREAGDLRRNQAHYDVIVMVMTWTWFPHYWPSAPSPAESSCFFRVSLNKLMDNSQVVGGLRRRDALLWILLQRAGNTEFSYSLFK